MTTENPVTRIIDFFNYISQILIFTTYVKLYYAIWLGHFHKEMFPWWHKIWQVKMFLQFDKFHELQSQNFFLYGQFQEFTIFWR